MRSLLLALCVGVEAFAPARLAFAPARATVTRVRSDPRNLSPEQMEQAKQAFQAMIDGDLNCTVECNPLIGPQLFDIIEKVAAGESVPKRVKVEEGVFTASEAAELIDSRQY